jgi:FlgD Ig-like domain/CARDB
MKIFLTTFLICLLAGAPAAALIQGSSTASNCGEGGNWIEITFTSDEGVSLVDAWWDFNSTNVWLDADGVSMCEPINIGVPSYSFYFDGPVGSDTQDFGLTATGFGSGDLFRFIMDLDLGSTGMPYGADYMGGTVTVEFSNGTILTGVFDTPYDLTNGATANFGNLANLEFTQRPGWAGPVVPRSANDATFSSVPAPTFLIGEADSTWINAVYQNTGDVLAGSTRMNFHLDGSFLGSRNLWVIEPGAWNGPVNAGPYNVPGGRHILRVTADALNAVVESDETDNVLSVQYCWQGDFLAPLAVETRAAPPKYDQDFEYGGGGSWWNCDGVRIAPSASYDWCAVWSEREADDGQNNYPLRLHPASDDPENAFGSNLGMSSTDENLHALLINTHTMGGGPWDVGIMNFSDNTEDYRIGHLHESPYPFDFGIEPSTPYTATRLMMFQFHVGTSDLGQATLTAYTNPDNGPVRMGWLPPDFTHGNLGDLLDEVVTDAEGCAKINLDLTETGEYCAVVYANRAEHPGGLAVNVGLYHAMPDFVPRAISGWYAPIVPRPAADSALFSCPLPDTLHGNLPQTWMNMAGFNDGLTNPYLVSFGLDIDGGWDFGLRNAISWAPANYRYYLNVLRQGTPWQVRGGRHTLSLRLDYMEEIDECVERNNDSGRQYCWSPQILPTNGLRTFDSYDALPDRTGGWDNCDGEGPLYWNCDGLRLPYIPPIGGNMRWCALAVMPWTSTLDIDLQLHDLLIGTQDGFGPEVLASSTSGDGQVDFVLVNDRYAPNHAHDVGVLEDMDGNSPGYYAQEARSTWGGIAGPGKIGPFTMGPGRMLNLHEYLVEEGPMLITLSDNDSGVDWGISLYQDGMYHGKNDVLPDAMAWQEGPGESEHLLVNLPAGSTFCLAVWKTDTGELAKDGSYSLWFAPGVSGVEDMPAVLPSATRIVSAAPNPFNPRTKIAFELERDGHCHLALYDLEGRLVRTLISEDRRAGADEVEWDGMDNHGARAASGVYLARLQAADTADLLKVTLMK